jgi:hypothetical protein
MRGSIVFAALLPAVLLADEPKVTSPISSGDVQQICKLVATATSDPVGSISGVLTSEPLAGAVPRASFHFAENGTRVPSTSYERADLVWAITSRKKTLPTMYKLEKSAHGWKIISKKQMVD